MIRKFASFAFGCRVNEAEKLMLDRKLSDLGFQYSQENPDVYIINSCAVTAKAEHEVRQFVNRIRRLFPRTEIIVTGCSATQWLRTKTKITGADHIIANNQKNEIVNMIGTINSKTGNGMKKPDKLHPDKFTGSGRFIFKIQDGCSRFCSYCIVPYLRGKPKTKSIGEIISEIKIYGDSIREVILSAINTEYFGIGSDEDLPMLLDAILKQTSVDRISLGSIHPWSINSQFLDWYKNNSANERFVHFFHIPIQSGSDKILKLMNRGYTSADMLDKLNLISKLNPSALIGTDIITGFPGETDTEFQQTYDFLKGSPVSKFHIFRYSPRSGTKAVSFENKYRTIDADTKIKQAKILAGLGKIKYREFISKMTGQTARGLLLETYKNGYQEAILPNQITVSVKTESQMPPGKIVELSVKSVESDRLYASVK